MPIVAAEISIRPNVHPINVILTQVCMHDILVVSLQMQQNKKDTHTHAHTQKKPTMLEPLNSYHLSMLNEKKKKAKQSLRYKYKKSAMLKRNSKT